MINKKIKKIIYYFYERININESCIENWGDCLQREGKGSGICGRALSGKVGESSEGKEWKKGTIKKTTD